MNPANKEIEGKVSTEQIAIKEVDSYIERIEKQAENVRPPLQASPSQTTAPTVQDDTGKMIMQASKANQKPQIVLPITEEELQMGLHHKIVDGIRWLAEWAVFMIRKYPGRVFYKQNK